MKPSLNEASQTQLWQQLIRDAADYNGVPLDEELESYLVFVLMRYLEDARLASRTMATEYLSGMQSTGKLRVDQMREVGDQCLLYSGLFPERARRRAVSVSYYVNLGRTAYSQLAELTQNAIAHMYQHVAESFITLMDTLQATRCIGKQTAFEPLLAYQHWQDQSQRHAARQFGTAIPVDLKLTGVDPETRH